MATATVQLTVNGYPNGVDNTQRHQVLIGRAGLSAGGTYASNGLPFAWTFLNAEGGAFVPNFDAAAPVWAEFHTVFGGVPGGAGGYATYLWDTLHQTLRIYVAGVELAPGAAIAADGIGFRVEFVKGA